MNTSESNKVENEQGICSHILFYRQVANAANIEDLTDIMLLPALKNEAEITEHVQRLTECFSACRTGNENTLK